MSEIPSRYPPSLYQPGQKMSDPFFECGQEVRLAGRLVVCVRRKGHPVALNYGHSNGYEEWCFDAP